MKNLVIYYTNAGNTEVVAREIHGLVGGDLKKIEEKKQRKPNAIMGAAFAALIGLKSRLKPMDFSLDGYENIFLGVQVWAAHSTPAINTFLGKADFRNKRIYLFLTKADDKVPQAVIDSISKRVVKKGGTIVDSFSITTVMNSVISSEAVREPVTAWIEKLNI